MLMPEQAILLHKTESKKRRLFSFF